MRERESGLSFTGSYTEAHAEREGERAFDLTGGGFIYTVETKNNKNALSSLSFTDTAAAA